MSLNWTKRTKQRKQALRILFEMDIGNSSLEEVLKGKFLAGQKEPSEFTISLVTLVLNNREKLDDLITRYAKGWDLGRMPVLDRNILRMALAEIFFIEDVPPGVTIDEAVELAREFSTEDSGKFVNGVLGRINRDREEGKIQLQGLP